MSETFTKVDMLRSGISAMVLITLLATLLAAQPAGAAELEGWAVLPAYTFAPGPPSGAQIEEDEVNGRNPPFSSQPVQGFSAVIDVVARRPEDEPVTTLEEIASAGPCTLITSARIALALRNGSIVRQWPRDRAVRCTIRPASDLRHLARPY